MSNLFDIDVSPESPELLEFAKTTLRETPENREAGFKELRELLKQNPDLSYRDDEAFLTIILRCCHWYPESAIKLVSNVLQANQLKFHGSAYHLQSWILSKISPISSVLYKGCHGSLTFESCEIDKSRKNNRTCSCIDFYSIRINQND